MPTEAEIQAQAETTKVTFTPEQQAKINDLIREAQGRAASELRASNAELATKQATLQAELDSAKETLKAAKTSTEKNDARADIEAIKAEAREAVAKAEQERVRLANDLKAAKQREDASRENLEKFKKGQELTKAAGKLPFFDVDMVINNTANNVKWDEASGKYIVVGDHGQARMNAAYEPMGLDEYYQEYAAKNAFLVRGEVKPGTSATANTRFDVSNDGRVPLDQLFGPKSNSVLSNQLALTNKAEWLRLRGVAQDTGLIPKPRKG